jgi:hypothetical protein
MAAYDKKAKTVDTDGKVSSKRRFDKRDFSYVAEYIIDTFATRKRDRRHLELHWAEIDRQIAMEPNTAFKLLPNGGVDKRKLWMSEMELPLQAQALEVLVADSRRMLFPDSGPWFKAHAEVTDEYLSRVDFQSIILGDETEVPSLINQDNADKLVEGFLTHQFRQYDLAGRVDRVNAEAFKYGMGVARGRMQTKSLYMHEARGTMKEEQRMPVLLPCSIKNLYLDNPMPSMHTAHALGESHIAHDYIRYETLALAMSKGSTDPDDEDGGWMPKAMETIVADDKGYVQLLEMEGDIIVPRKSMQSIVLPGCIATVAIGGKDGGNVTKGVIRLRWRKTPFSSYLLFPYHYEGVDSTYPSSPLMKGRPVQMMATDALNRLMDSAALKNAPPVGYDRNDANFAQAGGPEIFPYAQWPTVDEVKVYSQIGGDPGAMAAIMSQGISLYAELTGVLPSRLGAQTVSHTTAFAKDAELQRGAVRTVDYVNAVGKGAVERWLHMAYGMSRAALKNHETISFYIDSYGGFVQISKAHLPDASTFDWFGSGGPAEAQQKARQKLSSLQLAMQMDTVAMQTGRQPTVNIAAAIRETLREGGWTDIDAIVNQPEPKTPLALPAPMDEIQPNPGAQTVALQQLGLANE